MCNIKKIGNKRRIKDGKKIKKQVMVPFNVFEKNHLIETMLKNGHAPFEGTDEQEYNADMEAYQMKQQLQERV